MRAFALLFCLVSFGSVLPLVADEQHASFTDEELLKAARLPLDKAWELGQKSKSGTIEDTMEELKGTFIGETLKEKGVKGAWEARRNALADLFHGVAELSRRSERYMLRPFYNLRVAKPNQGAPGSDSVVWLSTVTIPGTDIVALKWTIKIMDEDAFMAHPTGKKNPKVFIVLRENKIGD